MRTILHFVTGRVLAACMFLLIFTALSAAQAQSIASEDSTEGQSICLSIALRRSYTKL